MNNEKSINDKALYTMPKNASWHPKFWIKLNLPAEKSVKVDTVNFVKHLPEGLEVQAELDTKTNLRILVDSNNNLYVSSEGADKIYANEHSCTMFSLLGLKEINGLSMLDTSMVVNADGMFYRVGNGKDPLKIDGIENLDFSAVKNAKDMFCGFNTSPPDERYRLDLDQCYSCGRMHDTDAAPIISNGEKIDFTKIKLPNAENIAGIYSYVSLPGESVKIDKDNCPFNPEVITDARGAFFCFGERAKSCEIDLHGVNFKNLTYAQDMFRELGINSENASLNLKGANFPKVKDMHLAFANIGNTENGVHLEEQKANINISYINTPEVKSASCILAGYLDSYNFATIEAFGLNIPEDQLDMIHHGLSTEYEQLPELCGYYNDTKESNDILNRANMRFAVANAVKLQNGSLFVSVGELSHTGDNAEVLRLIDEQLQSHGEIGQPETVLVFDRKEIYSEDKSSYRYKSEVLAVGPSDKMKEFKKIFGGEVVGMGDGNAVYRAEFAERDFENKYAKKIIDMANGEKIDIGTFKKMRYISGSLTNALDGDRLSQGCTAYTIENLNAAALDKPLILDNWTFSLEEVKNMSLYWNTDYEHAAWQNYTCSYSQREYGNPKDYTGIKAEAFHLIKDYEDGTITKEQFEERIHADYEVESYVYSLAMMGANFAAYEENGLYNAACLHELSNISKFREVMGGKTYEEKPYSMPTDIGDSERGDVEAYTR